VIFFSFHQISVLPIACLVCNRYRVKVLCTFLWYLWLASGFLFIENDFCMLDAIDSEERRGILTYWQIHCIFSYINSHRWGETKIILFTQNSLAKKRENVIYHLMLVWQIFQRQFIKSALLDYELGYLGMSIISQLEMQEEWLIYRCEVYLEHVEVMRSGGHQRNDKEQ
jgi:hypothetical protein